MKKYLPIALIFITVILLTNCKSKKNNIKTDKEFVQYVTAFTSGTISTESSISVYLSKPLTNFDIENTDLFSFSPAIEGEAVLVGDRIIEFRPAHLLKPDTQYSVRFMLGKLIKTDKNMSVMPFGFKTIKQSFSISFDGLKNYNNNSSHMMKYSGTLITSDVADAADIESVLSAKFEGSGIDIAWQHDANRRKHKFYIDSLKRYDEKPVTLVLQWNGKPLNVDKEGEKLIKIPALNSFEIIDAEVISNPVQHIQIHFSDNLLKSQNIEGLVRLDNNMKLRLEINGNVINVWPEKTLNQTHELFVSEGITNTDYYKIKEPKRFLLQFTPPKPAIRFVGKGVIVPQNKTLEMPFETIGLKAVEIRVVEIFKENVLQFFQDNRFNGRNDLKKVGRLIYSGKLELNTGSNDLLKWNTYKVNLANLFNIEQGAIYRVQFRMKKAFSAFECPDSTKNHDKNFLETEETNNERYKTEWDNPGWYSDYYYPPGYIWDERNNPCDESYYNSDRFVSRNIFASDFGIIVKEGNNHKLNFVVTNLNTTEPEKGVTINIYNFQNRLIKTVTTDENGFAVSAFKKKPFFLIAKKNNRFGYLRLDDGSSLSMSNFNVTGNKITNGIKGFLYADRGVWRPGDTIFINLILDKKEAQLPDNYPVVFQLINPNGQITGKQVESENVNGFYTFKPVTSVDALTGNWKVEAKAGNVKFSKRIKIEAIKPNRLKINFGLPKNALSQNTGEIPLTVNWLHGAPARSLKVKIDALIATDKTKFEGYGKYTFTDPAANFQPHEETIFEGKLNKEGKTGVSLKPAQLTGAPGMLKIWFTTRVFEKSGDFSKFISTARYAPYKTFVGVKMPQSDNNWYKTDTDYFPEIVTVDAAGKPVSGDNIEVELYKIEWRWWWESGQENLAHYVSGNYYTPVKTWKLNNAKHLSRIKLNIKRHNWEDDGRYLLRVKDKTSGHATGITFYMSEWGSWHSGNSVDGATILTLNTDKKSYKTGDIINIKIPSAKAGKALVSLENGSKVMDIFWIKTEDKQTTFSLKAQPGMAPNFFVHVTLIQPYGQTENDAPLRLYGVIPINVEDPETILHPVINVPETVKPESKYTIRVSEKNRKKMTYTIAVVDEGLLSLTGYRTPSPHRYFYSKEALGVKTWDLYDYVAGAYGAKLEKAFAVGGGDNIHPVGKRRTSRFKPVVMFAGPFTVERGKTNSHEFVMPNYMGEVRIMVVAGNNKAYGETEKNVSVKKDLMLLATLPRVLSPGEEVQLPVTVFATNKSLNNVTVKVKTNSLLTVSDNSSKTISFNSTGEKMAYFNLKVSKLTGVAKVSIEAKSGNKKASYNVELNVENPNTPVTIYKSAMVEGGKLWQTETDTPGEKGTNIAFIEISGFPALNISKYLDYLISYPHGCIEQVTSSVFPQLYIESLTKLTSEEKLKTEDNIRTALNKLSAFQQYNGGFGYWPGASSVNEWGTNYAGHFLIEAEKRGYSLPVGLKSKWINYQKNAARNWYQKEDFRSETDLRDYYFTQAYRLYTLALAGSPDIGAMNRLREKSNLPPKAAWRLAAAYILTGQPEAAEKITDNLLQKTILNYESAITFGSELRDKAMILETLTLMNREKDAFEMLKNITGELNKHDWISTQTAAWCLTSTARFAAKFYKNNEKTSFELTVNGEKTSLNTDVPVVKMRAEFDKNNKLTVEYKNRGANATFVKIMAKGIPVGIDTHSTEQNLLMNTEYFDMGNNRIDPESLMQGQDFKLVVTVKNPGTRHNYENMVLSTVFPSGWEISNNRLNDIPEKGNSEFEYQDIRDDRVYTYFNLGMYKQKTFVFKLNATYAGKFYMPPVSCEAMYNSTIQARKPGRFVVIKR